MELEGDVLVYLKIFVILAVLLFFVGAINATTAGVTGDVIAAMPGGFQSFSFVSLVIGGALLGMGVFIVLKETEKPV
jgi:uncharacterized membrane protein YuzA (DUF378 family)